MKTLLFVVLVFFLSCKESAESEPNPQGFVATTIKVPGRGCSGSDSCTACKNCTGCRHCARKGGTCSVCVPPEEEEKEVRKTKKGKGK